MPQELLKFIDVGKGRFKVEIHGDFLKDCGVMDLNTMLPYLKHLRIVGATAEEVIQWVRDGECRAVFIEKPKA
jgi:hypothetical protein